MSETKTATYPTTTDASTSPDGAVDEAVAVEKSTQPAALTLEGVLWFAVVAVGVLLRVGALGRWPLSGNEARIALSAVGKAATVTEPPPIVIGPLAFNLVALGSWLFGATDVSVRVFPALVGIMLILLPWFARRLIGRGPALGAAMFIAVSPALSFFAGHTDDTIFSAFCALWFVIAVAHYAERPSRMRALHVALALGVGLTSGAGFWSVLVAGGLYLLFLIRERDDSDESAAWDAVLEARERLRVEGMRLGGLVLASVLFVSTAAFTNPSGLAQALSQSARWIGVLVGQGTELAVPFSLVLLLYELPILIWAALGASIWLDDHPHWTRFLLLWAGVTLVPATLTNSGWAGGIAHVALPLTVLAGVGVARTAGELVRNFELEFEGLYGGLALLGVAFVWLNLLAYSLGGETLRLWLAAGGFVLIGALFVLMAVWVNLASALRTAGAVLLVALVFISFRSAWQLNYDNAANPREPLVVAPTDPDVRYMSDFLRPVSENRINQPDLLPVAVQQNLGPVPLWYLRDFRQVSRTAGSSPEQPVAVLLSPSEPPPTGWTGQQIRLGERWDWPGLSGQSLVRWLIYRKASNTTTPIDAILYLRVP